VGFDDVPEAGFFLPPLTTVRQDFGELGRRALNLLVDGIAGISPARAVLPVTPELIVRGSAGPARR
jgi:DNA-binding LacI/PurR family transcriptional regulator